jgi:hypothetical protein
MPEDKELTTELTTETAKRDPLMGCANAHFMCSFAFIFRYTGIRNQDRCILSAFHSWAALASYLTRRQQSL